MNRFRPTVEALDARAVPSSVIAEVGDTTEAEAAAVGEIVVTKDQDTPTTNIVVTKDLDIASTN